MSDIALAKQFVEVIPLAMRVIRHEFRFVDKSDLSVPQFRVLACLSQRRCTNGYIAEMMGNSRPSVSRMVNGLVKRGLVRQARDLRDRRTVHLKLTAKGLRKFQTIKNETSNRFLTEFSRLTLDDKKALREGLDALGKVFAKHGNPGGRT